MRTRSSKVACTCKVSDYNESITLSEGEVGGGCGDGGEGKGTFLAQYI